MKFHERMLHAGDISRQSRQKKKNPISVQVAVYRQQYRSRTQYHPL